MSGNPSEDMSGGTDYYSGSHNVCLFRKGGRIPAESQDIVQIHTDPNRYSEMLALTHSHRLIIICIIVYACFTYRGASTTHIPIQTKLFASGLNRHIERFSALFNDTAARLRSFCVLADFSVTWWSKPSVSGQRTKWQHGHFAICLYCFENHAHDQHNFWAYVCFDNTVLFEEKKITTY